MMRRPELLVLFLALLASPADAGVQWTATMRNVGSESIVTNATEFALDTDNGTTDAQGMFVVSVLADTMVTGVTGSSTSEQSSDLFAEGFTGTGAFDTMTDVTDPEGFADVFGRSVFNGYFDVDAPTRFVLTGSITNGGLGASAQMFLHGPGGFIVNVQPAAGNTIPVDATGILDPGSYLVSVNAGGNAQNAPPDLMTSASGEWQMSFLLGGGTAAPATASGAGLRVFPNPARGRSTISLAAHPNGPVPVRVLDAAGRLVRSLDAAAGSVVWDTRDAAGRPVPAGVYFVTVRRDDRLETGRVTVLR